jgi:hypothetical protein
MILRLAEALRQRDSITTGPLAAKHDRALGLRRWNSPGQSAAERLNSTLLGHSAFAPGMALPAPMPTFRGDKE